MQRLSLGRILLNTVVLLLGILFGTIVSANAISCTAGTSHCCYCDVTCTSAQLGDGPFWSCIQIKQDCEGSGYCTGKGSCGTMPTINPGPALFKKFPALADPDISHFLSKSLIPEAQEMLTNIQLGVLIQGLPGRMVIHHAPKDGIQRYVAARLQRDDEAGTLTLIFYIQEGQKSKMDDYIKSGAPMEEVLILSKDSYTLIRGHEQLDIGKVDVYSLPTVAPKNN